MTNAELSDPGPTRTGSTGNGSDAALVAEATRKSGLVWVTPAGAERAWPAWHLWHEGSAYVLTGAPGSTEQPVPGLAGAGSALVTVRSKDNGGRLLSWSARVDGVPAGSSDWDVVAPLLLGKRLNSPDGQEAPERWARECTVSRLTPVGEMLEGPGAASTASHADPPPASPATTRVRVPWTLHRRPGRKREL